MIHFNGKTYKKIEDNLYYGNQKIGKAFWGNILVYPEKQDEIDKKDIDIQGYQLNGWIYDTGYAPNKNTCVEICFTNENNSISSGEFGGFPIFGTHHDVYYAYGGDNEGYNSNGDENDWGSGKSYYKNYDANSNNNEQGWQVWKTNTQFHFIIKESQFFLRFGGVACQGTNNSVQKGRSFNTSDYNTSSYDIIKSLSGVSINNQTVTYWNSYIENGTERVNQKKIFHINVDESKWELGKGFGPYMAKKNETTNDYSGTIIRSRYNENEIGGNLWIGTHNRNWSSNENAILPNIIRNHLTYEQYCDNPLESITENTDININRFSTGKLAFTYIIIQEKKDDNVIRKNGKFIKYLFIPFETDIIDSYDNSKKIIAFKKFETNDGINFNDIPSEIIYPFIHKDITTNS